MREGRRKWSCPEHAHPMQGGVKREFWERKS